MSEVSEAMGNAIATVIQSEGNDLVLKWVTLIEVLDGETGERCIWTLASKDITTWDTLGMLNFGVQVEQAGHVAARFRRRDDE